jgi:hypothetical protein
MLETSKRLVIAGATGLVLAWAAIAAAQASAAITVPSFTLTPSTTQAGANPNLVMAATFAPTSGDDPQSVTMSLAPGLLANPTVPVACTASELQSNSCPAGSQIGTGTVSATAAGLPSSAPATLYLLQPQGDEVGRIGMVVSMLLGTTTSQASVTLRTSPDVGANITFANLPNTIAGTPVTVTGIKLTLNGTVAGKAFTRNPTSCQPATTGLTVTAYQGGTASASSAFTPTGCAALPFSPKLNASATVAGWDGETALSSTITQTAGEAAVSRMQLTLPYGVFPRSDLYSRACTASDPSTCPASATVGSATVTTPLAAQPLSGHVVLVSSGGSSTPGLAIVLPSPYAIVLKGTSSVTGQGYQTTYTNMPDLPLSSVNVSIAGGSDSMFVHGYVLCGNWQSLSGSFTGQNGATSTASAPITVSGCPV